jgi:hypothetical protein
MQQPDRGVAALLTNLLEAGIAAQSASAASGAPRTKKFFTSFLLAHCGGGQDKPGSLGPSAECPGCFFSRLHFHTRFLLRGFSHLEFRVSQFVFRFSNFEFYLFYFLYLCSPPTTGRIFPAAIFSSARSRSFSSPLSKRPSRYSHRRKSSARRSPFSELHSAQLETRLR